MLTKWFRTRSPRSPERPRFFRPELEALEGRLAPSNVLPMHNPGNGNGHGHGNGNGNGGGGDAPNPPPATITGPINNQTGNVHNNIHITNSFNGSSLTGVLSGENLGLVLFPSSALQGLFATLYTQALSANAAATNALVGAEANLAVNTLLMLEGMTPDVSAVENQITTNESALMTAGDTNAVLLGELSYALFLQDLVTPLATRV